MIILPEGAVIVQRDKAKEVQKEGLILSMSELKPSPLSTGTIIFTAPELKEFQHSKVRFRENFVEDIEIEGYKDLLYFRDLKSSMYYIIEDDKR